MRIDTPARIKVEDTKQLINLFDILRDEYGEDFLPDSIFTSNYFIRNYARKCPANCSFSLYVSFRDAFWVCTDWFSDHPDSEYTVKAMQANQYTYEELFLTSDTAENILDLFEQCLEV